MRFQSSRQDVVVSPPFRGSGHDSAKIVGRGSIPLGGTSSSYVAVWDGAGLQIRPRSVRFAGDVLRLFALTSDRAAVWCDSRWIISGPMTRQLSRGVAQEKSAKFGTSKALVRFQSPRRMQVFSGRWFESSCLHAPADVAQRVEHPILVDRLRPRCGPLTKGYRLLPVRIRSSALFPRAARRHHAPTSLASASRRWMVTGMGRKLRGSNPQRAARFLRP